MRLIILLVPFILSGCVYMFESDPSATCDDVKSEMAAEKSALMDSSHSTVCTFSHSPRTPKT